MSQLQVQFIRRHAPDPHHDQGRYEFPQALAGVLLRFFFFFFLVASLLCGGDEAYCTHYKTVRNGVDGVASNERFESVRREGFGGPLVVWVVSPSGTSLLFALGSYPNYPLPPSTSWVLRLSAAI